MKFRILLATVCALLLFCSGLARADEISDLKTQVEELRQKIEELEEKQEEQAESVEAMEEEPSAYEVVEEALAKQTTIGGHFKFFLGDQSTGEVTTASVTDDDQHDSFSFGINDLWLYFSKGLADWLQITAAPQVHVSAGATPLLGSDISRSTSADVDIDLDEGYMTIRAPYQVELRAGSFYPYFDEEYASKTWWHEMYHGNNGLLTLQAWQSLGLEVYRNFDFENFSLPVYLYLINGETRTFSQENQDSRFTDNNSAKNVMAHIAPEFFAFGAKFRILGSGGWGKWDDDGDNDSYQWAAGAEITYAGFTLMGNYLYRWREDLPLTGGGTKSGEDKGWYINAKYAFNPQFRLIVKYSDVDLWFPGTNELLTDNYKAISGALNWWITENSTIIPQIAYVDAERSKSSIKTEYFRYTLGWRTTF